MKLVRLLRLSILTLKLALVRHRATILLVSLVFILGLPLVNKLKTWFRSRPQTLVIGLVVESQEKEKLPMEVQKLLSRGLTTLDSSGAPLPAAASTWEVNPAGDEYRFRLRPGVTWIDGTPLKASDLHFQIPGVTIKVEDEQTLVFKLKNPYSPFPTVTAKPLFKKNYIGFGPYQLIDKETTNGVFDAVTLEVDHSRFRLKFYPNEDVARTALKLGEVDGLIGIRDPGDLINWPSLVSLTYYPRYRFVGLFYNTRDKWLENKEVRQALTYAVPTDFPGKPINGPIDPESWAHATNLKSYDYDFNKAKELLGSTTSAELVLTTLPVYEKLGKVIVKSWQSLGVNARLQTLPILPPNLSNFQVLLIGQKVPEDPDQYSLWHSTQPTNLTGYMSPRVDKLLEDARKSSDLEERKELYYKFQKYLVDDVPAAFLYKPEEYIFFTKRAKQSIVQRLIGDIIS